MAVFEVTVVKWVDDEGIEKREIGKLTLRSSVEGFQDAGCENYAFQINENSHPLVPRSLRAKGLVRQYPSRQSVWGLVREAIGHAITASLCH